MRARVRANELVDFDVDGANYGANYSAIESAPQERRWSRRSDFTAAESHDFLFYRALTSGIPHRKLPALDASLPLPLNPRGA